VGVTLVVGLICSALISIVSLPVYLYLRFVFGIPRGALITACVITALPFVAWQLTLWPQVLTSMWRTRFAESIVYERRK
jgi:hypothetical protein